MYCPKCGAENPDGAAFCASCGSKFVSNNEDVCPIWAKIVGFLFPIVGWILWGVWRKESPKKAKDAATWGWIGFALWFVINLIGAL